MKGQPIKSEWKGSWKQTDDLLLIWEPTRRFEQFQDNFKQFETSWNTYKSKDNETILRILPGTSQKCS